MDSSNIYTDRLPLWWLVRATDTPFRDLVPLLQRAGIYIYRDEDTGEKYARRSDFREFLHGVAAERNR